MLFSEVMKRLEAEAKALKEGRGSRMDWRILTLLYCIKVGVYDSLCTLLLDLSERFERRETYTHSLMEEFRRDFTAFLKTLGEEGKRFLKEEMESLSNEVARYDHWWWRALRDIIPA